MELSKNKNIFTLKLKNRCLENHKSKVTGHNLNKDHQHLYFDQLKPLLVINWVLARQPYNRNASGEFVLEFLSWRMAYCVVFYCIELVVTAVTGWEVIINMQKMAANVASESTPAYDVTLYTMLLLIFLFVENLIPIINWMVAKRFISFLNRWKHFQDLHLAVTGEEVKLDNYARFISAYAVASVIISIGMDVFESYFIMSYLHWAYVLPFMFITIDTLCLTATWAFSCYFIGSACNSIHDSFVRVSRSSSGSGIAAHRILWLELRQVYADYCASQEYRMLTLLLLVLVCLVISSYGVATSLFNNSTIDVSLMASFSVAVLYAICQLIIICEFGHRASIKIGDNFCKKLDWIQSSRFTTQEWHEMETFVECMETSKPGARVCGVFTINRKLFMQVIYQIASYLIILVQFQASEKKRNLMPSED